MKKIIYTFLFVCITLGLIAQTTQTPVDQANFKGDNILRIYETPQTDHFNPESHSVRGELSEWFNFTPALNSFLANKMNYYTLLFPDTITSIFENSSTPGTYNLGKVRNHSVGSVFCPSSEILRFYGKDTLNRKQPYRLDSFAIEYNYMRFSDDNVTDTLIINIFKPQKLLYYSDNKIPKGSTVKYDVQNNKGRDYSEQIVYLLTSKDTITYHPNGKGLLSFGLNNFNISPSSYGNPVAITWTYKPGQTYFINDTLNGDFNQSVPHSALNHFIFWNFNDLDDYEVLEYNNGLFIYSWTNELKYLGNTTYGPLYWRGTSFMNKVCYPVCRFKITYDPDWVNMKEIENEISISNAYPNPASENLNFAINNSCVDEMNVEVMDVMGRVIYKSVETIQDNHILSIPVQNLKAGIYHVKFVNNKEIQYRTFIKN